MVFESIVAEMLNRFLNKYVENVDHSQLKIGIWGGDVVLEHLLLKAGALDELDLPIKTTYGQLGKLVLKIPWTNLYTAPVIIFVERFFLLAVPNRDIKYDPVKEEQWLQDAKEHELQKMEERKQRQREKNQEKIDETFTEKLVAQIIRNVQIKVNNVHIRYEDRTTNPEKPFSLGLTLAHFYLNTTDRNWVEAIIQENVSKVNKVVEVEYLAIYWNCNCKLFKEKCHNENTSVLKVFLETICTKDHRPHGFHYILEPINSSMRMLMNSKPENDNYEIPKYDIEINLKTLAIGINKFQYRDLVRLADSLNRMALSALYRKYRPQLNVYRGNYKVWWKFAYICILEEEIRRVHLNWNWNHISRHRQRCRTYAATYRSKLDAKKVPKELISKLQILEKDLDVLNILLIREQVEIEVVKARLLDSEQPEDDGWFSWFSGTSTPEETATDRRNVLRVLEHAMTPNEKAKLYKAIDYKEHSLPIHYPDSFVAIRLQFNLDTFQVEITDRGIVTYRVMHLALSKVSVDMEQRPTRNALKVKVVILRFSVYGLKQGSFTPVLVVSKNITQGENLLYLRFELNPLDDAYDQRLIVYLKSLQIVYDSRTIQKVCEVFSSPVDSSTLHKLQVQLENVKDMSATGLQHAIEQHPELELKVDIKAPYIIIPHSGIYKHNEDILVLNLGRFVITSFVRNIANKNVQRLHKKGISEEGILRAMVSQSYDKFFLDVKNMQILIVLNGEDWFGVLERNKVTPLHVLEPLCFIVIFNVCLIKDDPKLPKTIVTATLSNVAINLTNIRLLHLYTILSSIPRLNNENEEKKVEQVSVDDTMQLVSDAFLLQAYWDAKEKRYTKEEMMRQKREEQSTVNKMQAIILDLTFGLECITVKGFLVETAAISFETTTKFLTLQFIKIEVEMLQQTFDMNVIIRLGGISMDVYDSQEVVRIIDTPMTADETEADYLFTCNYIQVDKKSPELHSMHNNTLQFLEVHFSTLYLLLHQEILLFVVEVIGKFKSKLQEAITAAEIEEAFEISASSKPRFKDIQIQVLHRIREKKLARMVKFKLKQTQTVGDETSLRLKSDLQKIKISIKTRTTMIAEILIAKCYARIAFMTSKTELAICLEKLQVLDCHPNSCHPQIVSVVGDETLSIELIKYNIDKLFSHNKEGNPDMTLTVKIACIRIIYLNRFVSSFLSVYSNLQVVNTLFMVGTAESVATTSKQSTKEVVDDADYILLNIDIDAPIIIVPLNSQSRDAVLLDLGYLTISNDCHTLSVVNGNGVLACIDNIKLKLKETKVNRVKLREDYGIVNEIAFLNPFTFEFEIERNLSSWNKCVPDCDISAKLPELNFMLTEEDYKLVLKILQQNWAEADDVTQNKVEYVEEFEELIDISDSPKHIQQFDSVSLISDTASFDTSDSVRVSLKLSISLDNITIDIFTGGARTLDNVSKLHSKAGFARFVLQSMYLGSIVLSNGSQRLTFMLNNCFFDDMREGRPRKNMRFIQLKNDLLVRNTEYNSGTDPNKELPIANMMDITYLKKDNDTFVDVYIHSFELILSLEYLIKLGDIFDSRRKEHEVVQMKDTKQNTLASKSTSKQQTSKRLENPVSSMTLNVKIEKPDIGIVEGLDNIDNNALFINTDIISRIRFVGHKMMLNAYVEDLQLYTCCFNPLKRKTTRAIILRPCTIRLLGLTPDKGGLFMDICITDIRVGLSPGIIDLFYKISNAISGDSIEPVTTDGEGANYSEIWKPKELLDDKFWFLITEEGQSTSLNKTSKLNVNPEISQICIISAPSMIITFDSGDGKQRQPLILMELKLECTAHDWSSNLFINSNLALQVAYYNNHLALWEPLIEPIERVVNGKQSKHSWELKADLQMNNSHVVASGSTLLSQTSMEDIVSQPAGLSIAISSKEKLELTVTKTCIEVLTHLSKVLFETSMSSVSGGASAPCVVKNLSGIPVTVILHEGPFKVLVADNNNSHHEMTLKSGFQLELCLQDEEASTVKLKDGPVISGISIETRGQINKGFLNIRIQMNTRSCVLLAVPIFRADKRYFSLKHSGENGFVWGLVTDVKICNGGTILTLRGIIQILNHMSQPIHIYCLKNQSKDLVCFGTVQAANELLLPLHCIYTTTSELFFCIKDYKVTSESFSWRNLHEAHMISKLLYCSAKNAKIEMPFFIHVVGYSKQVNFENTSHYTPESIIYIIHLYPAVTIENLLPVDLLICLQDSNLKKETIIKMGEHLQMANIEPEKSKMLVIIPSYQQKKWLSKEHIKWETPTFDVLRLTTSGDKNQQESVEMQIHKKESNGLICMQISCQFWMLNKTGLSLSYMQFDERGNISSHDKKFNDPVLFSFWGTPKAKKNIIIMITNGTWSDPFSLDATGSSGVVTCLVDKMAYQIGVQIRLSHSQLTKQVTFTPFFVLVNNHLICIECQEADCPDDPWVKVVPGDCIPFWPHSSNQHKELHLRIENSTEVSSSFSYYLVHSTLIKLDKNGGVFVDVHKIEAAIYITFLPYKPGLAPTLLINHTNQPICFYEENKEKIRTLNRREMVLFTWNKPTGSRMITYKLLEIKEFSDDLQTDGFQELSSKSGECVYWVSFLDGVQRVTLFTTSFNVAKVAQLADQLAYIDTEITLSIRGIGISLVNNTIMKEILYISTKNSDIIWETRTSEKKQFKPLSAQICQKLENAFNQFHAETNMGRQTKKIIKVASNFEVNFETKEVIQPTKRYLQRSYEEGIWFQMKTSRHQSTMHGKINHLQIDNQICDSVFPVLFAPVPLPKTMQANCKKKAFAECYIVRRCMEHNPVQHYRYFKILIQEFHVKVDLNFLFELFEFVSQLPTQEDAFKFAEELKLAREPLMTNVFTTNLNEVRTFYEVLHFSPLKIHLSFSMFSKKHLLPEETSHFAIVLLHSLGVSLTEIHDVVLKLGYIERKNTLATYNQLYAEVYSHYINELLKNAYVLIFGLDLIGNPWGFLMGIGKGVQDLFYEPYLGAIQGPEEFGKGVLLGLRSLFGSAAGGVCRALSTMTGAVGSGIAVLSCDDDYQRERKEKIHLASRSIQATLALSSKGLVMGMVHGMSGVVVKPVTGAHREGMAGFFKGAGKGMAGLVVRPTVGLFDFISGFLSVVPIATKYSNEVARVRPPRYLHPDGLVRSYIRSEAEGNLVLQKVEQGEFVATDKYVYHMSGVNGTRDILLLTDKRIMYIEQHSIIDYLLTWECKWKLLQPPYINREGIIFFLGHKRKSPLRSCSSKELTIHVENQRQRKMLAKKIKELIEVSKSDGN